MKAYKNILIIGGTGYLGSKFIDALLFSDLEIFCWKRSNSDIGRLAKLADRIEFYEEGIANLKEYIKIVKKK